MRRWKNKPENTHNQEDRDGDNKVSKQKQEVSTEYYEDFILSHQHSLRNLKVIRYRYR